MSYIGFSELSQNLSKSSKAGPNLGQDNQRKKAWFSLDSLVGIEPFQWVAPTPKGKNFFPVLSPLKLTARRRILIRRLGQYSIISAFRK
jgi:hypothetical protein